MTRPSRRRAGCFAIGVWLVALAVVARPSTAWSREQLPGITPPTPISDTSVAYPEGVTGDQTVVLELVVDAAGAVTSVRAIQGAAPFSDVAAKAAKTWRFTPARRNGEVVAVRFRFAMDFTQAATPAPPDASRSAVPDDLAPAAGVAVPVPPPPPPVEIEVQGQRQAGARQISRAEARQLPGAFGETFRAIEMYPGVTPTLSGAPYFYVRGAPPGNLGYFLDDIRLPALFHVLAGPSVVHPALVDSVDFYAGPYPARYGRFSGGVVAGHLREATGELHGEANLRAYDSSALVEVPLTDHANLTLAGRYSYANPVAQLFAPDIAVLFWDYQARLATQLTRDDRITIFGFGSRDELDETNDDGEVQRVFGAEFHRLDLAYQRTFPGGSVRVRSLVGFDQSVQEQGQVELTSWISQWRADVTKRFGRSLGASAGIDANEERHRLTLRRLEDAGEEADYLDRFPSRVDAAAGAYASLEWQATAAVHVAPGVRTDIYHSLDSVKVGVSPRINAEFVLSPQWTVLHGFGIADQPPSAPLPQPGSTPKLGVGLQRAFQSNAGVRFQVPDVISVQALVFQTALFNLSDEPGVSRIDNGDDSITESSRATGASRGLELFVQRSFARRLSGYLAYTLSFSRRSLERAEGPSLFDRRHVLSGAVTYRFQHGYRAGVRGTYYTGLPADVAYLEAARDPPRTSPFYRVDVRAEKRWQLGDRGAYWAIVLEVLNTTLEREALGKSCNAYTCVEDEVGPVTIPSLGVEVFF